MGSKRPQRDRISPRNHHRSSQRGAFRSVYCFKTIAFAIRTRVLSPRATQSLPINVVGFKKSISKVPWCRGCHGTMNRYPLAPWHLRFPRSALRTTRGTLNLNHAQAPRTHRLQVVRGSDAVRFRPGDHRRRRAERQREEQHRRCRALVAG